MEAPRIKFAVQAKEGLSLKYGPNSLAPENALPTEEESASSVGLGDADIYRFSPDGQKVVCVKYKGDVTIRNSQTGEIVQTLEQSDVRAVAWSPLGRFLVTWSRPAPSNSSDAAKSAGNLVVWNALSGAEVARYHQRQYRAELWPMVQWTEDENFAARMVTNEIHIYKGDAIEDGITSKIILPGVGQFSVAPGPELRLCLFVPEKKGKPASVRVFKYPDLQISTTSKSFYKAQEVSMLWHPQGEAVLVKTSTDVDTSGKSYYGESNLFLLHGDGKYDCSVPLTKEGPIFDAQWAPDGRGFGVVAGTVPAHSTLYDNKAQPVFEFGAAARNVLSFSPHGRFICIAGFGNLAGEIDFWDRHKLKKMGTATAEAATTYCWAPDGRYFATATTFPRMRVDNGYSIFNYFGGSPVLKEEVQELYDFQWQPAAKGVYPDRPQSPGRKKAAQKEEPPKPKAQAYRPPGARGQPSPMSILRGESSATGSGRIDRHKYAPGGGRVIPGLVPKQSQGKSQPGRNSRRRQNRDNKDAESKDKADSSTNEAVSDEAKAGGASASAMTSEQKEKRIKALRKKLKQLDGLKDKVAKGEALNEDQQAKLASEQEIVDELKTLEG